MSDDNARFTQTEDTRQILETAASIVANARALLEQLDGKKHIAVWGSPETRPQMLLGITQDN